MSGVFVRNSSTWKRVTRVWVRVSGLWRPIKAVYVRAGGVWKRVHPDGGQQEWLAGGTYSFVVPTGVTSIHAAVVGASISRGAATLMSSDSAIGAAFGGGDGGSASGSTSGGGGGAGGYSGNGGDGHPGEVAFGNGSAGAGGGGGGGRSAASSGGQHGGGVYLHGAGTSGAGGTASSPPGAGSNLGEGAPRGAGNKGGSPRGSTPGRNLRYTKTAIAVTAGEMLTVVVSAQRTGGDATTSGGARIIWGAGRSYPSNAKDV